MTHKLSDSRPRNAELDGSFDPTKLTTAVSPDVTAAPDTIATALATCPSGSYLISGAYGSSFRDTADRRACRRSPGHTVAGGRSSWVCPGDVLRDCDLHVHLVRTQKGGALGSPSSVLPESF